MFVASIFLSAMLLNAAPTATVDPCVAPMLSYTYDDGGLAPTRRRSQCFVCQDRVTWRGTVGRAREVITTKPIANLLYLKAMVAEAPQGYIDENCDGSPSGVTYYYWAHQADDSKFLLKAHQARCTWTNDHVSTSTLVEWVDSICGPLAKFAAD